MVLFLMMDIEVVNQAQNKIDECISKGDLLGAERWLIAFERNIANFSYNFQGRGLKQILNEKKMWLERVIRRIDDKKAKPIMKNLRSLLCYGKINNSTF